MSFGNLGIAMGAGVDEYRRGQEQDRLDVESKRRQDTHDAQMAQAQRLVNVQKARDAVMAEDKSAREAYISGDPQKMLDAVKGMSSYHGSTDLDGSNFSNAFRDPETGKLKVAYANAKSGTTELHDVTPDMFHQSLGAVTAHKLAAADPDSFLANYKSQQELGLKGQEVGIKRDANEIHRDFYKGKNEIDRAEQASRDFYQRGMLGVHQSNARNAAANTNAGHYMPLQSEEMPGFSFNQKTGGFHDVQGNRVTDPTLLGKLYKVGTQQKPGISPEQDKAFRSEMAKLPPPPPDSAQDTRSVKARAAWKSQADYLRKVYGVAPDEAAPLPMIDPTARKQVGLGQTEATYDKPWLEPGYKAPVSTVPPSGQTRTGVAAADASGLLDKLRAVANPNNPRR